MGTINGMLFVALTLALCSGCVHRVTDIKTLTIHPQKEPVVVTCRGTAEWKDMFLIWKLNEYIELNTSNDKK
jgi:hypothetical protein